MTRKIIGVLFVALFLFASVLIATAADNPPRIMADEVKAKLDNGQKIIFIDTRTGSDWKNSNQMIPGAIRLRGRQDFATVLATLHKDDFIVTYCTWPNEASSASLALAFHNAGYKYVYPLEGGMYAWEMAGNKLATK